MRNGMLYRIFAMNSDQGIKMDAAKEKPIGFLEDVKKNAFGSTAFGWGFALGFLFHKDLIGIGKPGLLWRFIDYITG